MLVLKKANYTSQPVILGEGVDDHEWNIVKDYPIPPWRSNATVPEYVVEDNAIN